MRLFILTVSAILTLSACADAPGPEPVPTSAPPGFRVLGPAPIMCCDIVDDGGETTCFLLDGYIVMSPMGQIFCDTPAYPQLVECHPESLCYIVPTLLPEPGEGSVDVGF